MNSVPKQDQRLEHEKRGGRFDNRKIIAQILSNDMRTDEFIAKLIAPFFTPCLYVSGKGYLLEQKCLAQTKEVVLKLILKKLSDLKFKYIFFA